MRYRATVTIKLTKGDKLILGKILALLEKRKGELR